MIKMTQTTQNPRVQAFVDHRGRDIAAVVTSHQGNQPSLMVKLRNLEPFAEPPLTDEEVKSSLVIVAAKMRADAIVINREAALLDIAAGVSPSSGNVDPIIGC